MRFILLFLLCFVGSQINAASPSGDILAGYLEEGKLGDGIKALESALGDDAKNDSLRFQLGIAQFFSALEKLEQDWHRLGLRDSLFGQLIPFLRLPVPHNQKPERVTNESARKVIADFVARLGEVAQTLAKVGDNADVKISLRPGLVRLDFDGDGRAGEDEVLWKVMARLMPGARASGEDAKGFLVKMDLGDVRWLQGYCHLLSAIGEVILAHDTQRLFQYTAPIFFADADTPFDFLKQRKRGQRGFFGDSMDDILDGLAFIHLLSFPVKDPQRMASALHHLEEVTKLSRQSWKAILAETDDDSEWIPNPKQTSVLGGAKVSEEMIKGWFSFLDEMDAILAGKKLLPFWREAGGRGVNLRRVFTEPTAFDLILWIQGTGAAAYLENGTITSSEFWKTTNGVFRGQFLGFALWFN
ncbi:MAG: hypothetical protein ABIP20_19895 [Chthoniobacteraceae bacterium]